MTDSRLNHVDSAAPPREDILTRIADRRERFVALLRQITGASAARAERVFRPLPFVDSRRRGLLGLTALMMLCAAAPSPVTAQSGSIGVWGGVFTPLKTNPDLGSIGGR